MHFELSSGQPHCHIAAPSPKHCSPGITQSTQTSLTALLVDLGLVPGLGTFWATWAPAPTREVCSFLAGCLPAQPGRRAQIPCLWGFSLTSNDFAEHLGSRAWLRFQGDGATGADGAESIPYSPPACPA